MSTLEKEIFLFVSPILEAEGHVTHAKLEKQFKRHKELFSVLGRLVEDDYLLPINVQGTLTKGNKYLSWKRMFAD